MNYSAAIILGLVEGLTEFLPVSSTGHLIIAGHYLHFEGEAAGAFEIFIQLGAILAVAWLYRERFIKLFDFKSTDGFEGVNGLKLLFLTTLPALVFGAVLHSFIKHHLFNVFTVTLGLGLGGIAILLTEKFMPSSRKIGLDMLSAADALKIGCFQCLALWPGVSRSASTILGAMGIGIDRKTAVEYSFFAAVPVLCAASALDLLKSRHALRASDIPFFAAGFATAFVSALLSVKWFVGRVSGKNLNAFGWYRILLASALIFLGNSLTF